MVWAAQLPSRCWLSRTKSCFTCALHWEKWLSFFCLPWYWNFQIFLSLNHSCSSSLNPLPFSSIPPVVYTMTSNDFPCSDVSLCAVFALQSSVRSRAPTPSVFTVCLPAALSPHCFSPGPLHFSRVHVKTHRNSGRDIPEERGRFGCCGSSSALCQGLWSWFDTGEQLRVQMEEGQRPGDIVWLFHTSWLNETSLCLVVIPLLHCPWCGGPVCAGKAELQRWDAHPTRVSGEEAAARRDSCSVCGCSIPGMYLLYFLAFLPVIGEELSSCSGVWMTKRSSPALRLGGALHRDKAPELEGTGMLGCCSARCDTLVAGLCVTSPPLSPQQGGCTCPPSQAGCWAQSAAVPCSGGSSVLSHRA